MVAHSQRVASSDQARPSSGPSADETLSLQSASVIRPAESVSCCCLLVSGLNTMDEEGKNKMLLFAVFYPARRPSINPSIYLFRVHRGPEGETERKGEEASAAAKNRSIRSFDSFSIFFISALSTALQPESFCNILSVHNEKVRTEEALQKLNWWGLGQIEI